jgi:glycosyltransferase involved in cell wall biosynthesis
MLQPCGGHACSATAESLSVAVVIPSFRGARSIGAVLRRIGPLARRIYVVDDGCPDGTADVVLRDCRDPRVEVIRNPHNLGVGGAVKAGYRRALEDGADIVVKLDADGQMDPEDMPRLLAPILAGGADYAKGNRFAAARTAAPEAGRRALRTMPVRRRVANRMLSLAHRGVTGYWRIGDPANGYTAVRAETLRGLDLDGISDCFFFETDMLFAIGRAGGRVADVPLPARYSHEGTSSLSLRRIAPRFAGLLMQRAWQRIAAGARG